MAPGLNQEFTNDLSFDQLGQHDGPSLFKTRIGYKPFDFEWAHQAMMLQHQMHWLPEEAKAGDDVHDFWHNLTVGERQVVERIMRYFTQADVEVADGYTHVYLKHIKNLEIKNMIRAFESQETIHQEAYHYLIDTLGLPEDTSKRFMDVPETRDKYEYTQQMSHPETVKGLASSIGVFGAFLEGVQLFSSFAVLLAFQRFNKMKTMGQIVAWSVRDEDLHSVSNIRIFHQMLSEHPQLADAELRNRILEECQTVVNHEIAFLRWAFADGGEVPGMTLDEAIDFVYFIADLRLKQLELEPIYNIENPFPWMAELLSLEEHVNFFEQRATEYAKVSTEGSWDTVWDDRPLWTVYSKSNCPQCDTAKSILKSRDQKFEVVMVEDENERMAMYQKLAAAGVVQRSMPIIYKGDEFFGGLQKLIGYKA